MATLQTLATYFAADLLERPPQRLHGNPSGAKEELQASCRLESIPRRAWSCYTEAYSTSKVWFLEPGAEDVMLGYQGSHCS